MKPTFHFSIGGNERTIEFDQLQIFARLLNLDKMVPGRFSWRFVLDLMIWNELYGHEPFQIVRQIEALETPLKFSGTKDATQFRNLPLKGLWHKHFFDAHFVAHNLQNHWNGGRLKKLIEEVFDPEKSRTLTKEMLDEFTHRIVTGAIEERDAEERLTGEWIVFAKHKGENYYLCLARHNEADEMIFERIKSLCFKEFPFLQMNE